MKTAFPAILASAILSAGAAAAGGFVAPVAGDVVVAPVVTATGEWQGGYVGATLGYGFGGSDAADLHVDGSVPGSPSPGSSFDVDAGKFKLHGVNAGLRVGYRWQSGQWVFGPELSVEGGSVKDSLVFPIAGSPSLEIESKLRSLVALKLKAGYEVTPQTLVTGHIGVAEGRFKYSARYGSLSDSISYSRTGYVVGIGIERRIDRNWSITGEIERNQFSKKNVVFAPGAYTEARPSFTNVKIGVNYSF